MSQIEPGHTASRVARTPIVGVMGSGTHSHAGSAAPLGRWLAEAGVNLLTGGGGGVMAAVSEAFASCGERTGRIIGILPGDVDENGHSALRGYPNAWIEIPIFTHLPRSGLRGLDKESRNHINVLSSNVIVVLPGSSGTASEASLALRYGTPVIAWLRGREQVAGLAPEVRVESRFGAIKEFVLEHAGVA